MRRAAHDHGEGRAYTARQDGQKLASQREELKKSENREELRRRGDLITANLWRAQKGARTLDCEDYYNGGLPHGDDKARPRSRRRSRTPRRPTRSTARQRTAEKHLTELIASGEKQLDYLESVLDVLGRAERESDVQEIRAELMSTGVLRAPRGGKQSAVKPAGPMSFVSSTGYEILVGRNNTQNDELTTKTAPRTDIWLHTQRVHGSHVIIRCMDTEPDEQTIAEAACLAAYYSEGAARARYPSDYCQGAPA